MIITDTRPYKITLEDINEYYELEDNCFGLCFNCGMDHYNCEPDAKRYYCDNCGEGKVYGLVALLEVGKITFEA
jgi:hypothetical protein